MDRAALPKGIQNHGGKIRIEIYHNKRRYRETLNLSAGNQKDVRQAVTYRKKIKGRLVNGLPAKDRDDSGKFTAFQVAAEKWLDFVGNTVKQSTYKDYVDHIRCHWVPAFKKTPLSEINLRDVREALAKMKIGTKTQKNRLVSLSGVFKHFEISPTPVAGITHQRIQKAEVNRYMPDERTKLMEALEGQMKVYGAMLFGMGLRPGEAFGLRWSDLVEGNQFKIVRQIVDGRLDESVKNYSARTVFCPEWALKIIKNHTTRFKGEYILVNKFGEAIRTRAHIYKLWARAHEKAGVEHREAYLCRHTRAAEFLSQGVLIAEAAYQMGHSPEMFLRTYSEWKKEFSDNRDLSHLEGVGLTGEAKW